jgi:hypothetical protein
MQKSLICVAFFTTLCSCDGAIESFDPSSLSEVNDILILVPRTAELNPIVDSVGHHQTTASPSPPFQGPFRIQCGLGECVKLNVFLLGITPAKGAWAAGKSCEEESPFSPIWPFKAKGPLGEVRDIRVCCPHDKPCTPVKPPVPGGADWIIGILPNGRLATDLATLETICPWMLEGAKEYPPAIHKRAFTWPENP